MRGLGRLTSGYGATSDAVGSGRDPGACRMRDCRAAPGVPSCEPRRRHVPLSPCSGGESGTGAHKSAALPLDVGQETEVSMAYDADLAHPSPQAIRRSRATRIRKWSRNERVLLDNDDMSHMQRRNPMSAHHRHDRTAADAQTRRCHTASANARRDPQITHAPATSCPMYTCVHQSRR